MAFNPFGLFRRNQKPLMVALLMVVMFLFILNFGRGDLFDRAAAWMGAGGRGPVVATINGKKITEGELEDIAKRRRLASLFLFNNITPRNSGAGVGGQPRQVGGYKEVLDDLAKRVTAIGATAKNAKDGNPLLGVDNVIDAARFRFDPSSLRMLAFQPNGVRQIADSLRSDLGTLAAVAARKGVADDAEAMEILRHTATVVGYQAWLASIAQAAGGPRAAELLAQVVFAGQMPSLYFGGGDRTEDLLDFVLWQQQADRLKITLSDADVRREVIAEAAGGKVFTSESSTFYNDPKVAEFVALTAPAGRDQRVRAMTTDDLVDALRQEFRVAMAQAVVLGEEQGVRGYRALLGTAGGPATATPDEFHAFFRDSLTTVRAAMTRVNVENYLGKVTAKPNESELAALFDQYKDREPRPDSLEPGFKRPRRVTVEAVVAAPADPYFADRGSAMSKLSDEKGRTLLALSAIGAPATNALVATIDQVAAMHGPTLKPWYVEDRILGTVRDERLRHLHLRSLLSGEGLTAAIGTAAGGDRLTAVSAWLATATTTETLRSARMNLAAGLFAMDPANTLGALVSGAANLEYPDAADFSASQLAALHLEELRKAEAKRSVGDTIDRIRKGLEDAKGQAAKQREAIETVVKEAGLKVYKSPSLVTRDRLRELVAKKGDPVLAALAEAVRADRSMDFMRPNPEPRNDDFVARYLMGNPGFMYSPQTVGGRDAEKVVSFWLTEDRAPEARSFAEAKEDVVAAWRFREARRLARADALAVVKKINDAKVDATKADAMLRESKLGPIFEQADVSQLISRPEVLPGRGGYYDDYNVPDLSIPELPYPPFDLAKQLTAMKRPGEAALVADRPAANFYVSVLMERTSPGMDKFREVYARTPNRDALYTGFLARQRAEYRKGVAGMLRREAVSDKALVDAEGRWKLPESARRRDLGGDAPE